MSDAADWFASVRLPLQPWIDAHFFWLSEHVRPYVGVLRGPVVAFTDGVATGVGAIPPPLLLAAAFLLAWQLNGLVSAGFVLLVLTSVGMLGVWGDMVQTFALIVSSVLLCLAVGLPLGYAAARSDRVQKTLTPVLDLMQTLPAFVYLVPIVLVVGIGSLPGILVAFVFAVPPTIRLTSLGLRSVPAPMVEAAQALGASPTKVLFSVEIPNALRTILLGLNQTIMMALAMVTYASMIGVGGLGKLVLQGIGRLDMGLATVGGLGIAALAILFSALIVPPLRERRSTPVSLMRWLMLRVQPQRTSTITHVPLGDRSHG